MSKLRKILFAVAAFGGAVTAVGAGTFASFNASTTNSGSTFATGTLVFSTQIGAVNPATACFTTGTANTGGAFSNGNANTGCGAVYNDTAQNVGGAASSKDLTLTNAGSLTISTLQYKATTCSASHTGTFWGSGDLCASTQIYIQEYPDATSRTNDTRTSGTCVFGGGTASNCAFSASKTLSTLPTTLTTLTGALSGSRYFRVYYQLPTTGTSAGDNVFQGLSSSWDLQFVAS